ncbi:preprotein translocase subunit SecE [candidate division KSB1 bacterium]
MINRIRIYLTSVRQEMNKVSWPTFHELLGSTYVVIIGTIIFAVFIFGVDRTLTAIMKILLQ